MREYLGCEARDIAEARQRLKTERESIDVSIVTMRDNISAGTRDLIEQQTEVLRKVRKGLKARAVELEGLSL